MPVHKTAVSICLNFKMCSLEKGKLFCKKYAFTLDLDFFWSYPLWGGTLLKSQAMKLNASIEISCIACVPWRGKIYLKNAAIHLKYAVI